MIQEPATQSVTAFPISAPGRRGLPRDWVAAMHADYLALGSLSATAERHGRTRQALRELFRRAKLPLRARNFLPPHEYRGVKYTPGKDGYMRAHQRGRQLLHKAVWQAERGPIPPGYEVGFRDHDVNNCAIANLICLPKKDMRRRNSTGKNQFTKALPPVLPAAARVQNNYREFRAELEMAALAGKTP